MTIFCSRCRISTPSGVEGFSLSSITCRTATSSVFLKELGTVMLQVAIEFLCLSIAVIQFLFTTLTSLLH